MSGEAAPLPGAVDHSLALGEEHLGAVELYERTGVLYVSPSSLAAFAACDLQGILKAMGYRPRDVEPGATDMRSVGKVGHRAREVYFKTKSIPQALAALDEAYHAIEPTPVRDNCAWENVRLTVGEYLDRCERGYPFSVRPEMVEVKFLVELHADPLIILRGQMDAVPHDETGCHYIDDFKMTGWTNARWLRQFKNSAQFKTYMFAAKEHGIPNVVGAMVSALELGIVPTSNAKCRRPEHGGRPYAECGVLHVQSKNIGPVLFNNTQMATWKRDALGFALDFHALVSRRLDLDEVLRSVRQRGAFNGSCGLCDFGDACDMGIEPRIAELLLTNEKEGESDGHTGTEG